MDRGVDGGAVARTKADRSHAACSVPAGSIAAPALPRFQDGRGQQNVADVRQPGAEQLFHQLTGQRAVLSGKLPEELVRVRMSVQGDCSQAEPSRPALCPLDQAFQLACRQRAAMPGQ